MTWDSNPKNLPNRLRSTAAAEREIAESYTTLFAKLNKEQVPSALRRQLECALEDAAHWRTHLAIRAEQEAAEIEERQAEEGEGADGGR